MPITLLRSADIYNGVSVANITPAGTVLPSVTMTVPHGCPNQRVVLTVVSGVHTLVLVP